MRARRRGLWLRKKWLWNNFYGFTGKGEEGMGGKMVFVDSVGFMGWGDSASFGAWAAIGGGIESLA